MPAGRPTIYTQELADEICQRLAEGESLRSICNGPPRFDPMTDVDRHSHMPRISTVLSWALNLDHEFSAQYANARAAQMEYWADNMDHLPDEYRDVQRARLKSDNRKWIMARLASSRYGDRIQTTVTGKDGESLDVGSTNQLASVLSAAFAKIGHKDNSDDDDT